MPTCPQGHESEADDHCSVCGLALSLAPGPVLTSVEGSGPSAAGSLACPNCSAFHGRDDVFCESCGYDFITGTLPAPQPAVTSTVPPVAVVTSGVPASAPTLLARVTVIVDPAFHERMDTDGVLTVPHPCPAPRTVELTSSPILVGRASPSRNLHPDLDISDDPAASGRHCRLDRRPDGVWTITDLGSTNGTYVGGDFRQLHPNVSSPLAPGTAVYVGAWTRLEVEPVV